MLNGVIDLIEVNHQRAGLTSWSSGGRVRRNFERDMEVATLQEQLRQHSEYQKAQTEYQKAQNDYYAAEFAWQQALI